MAQGLQWVYRKSKKPGPARFFCTLSRVYEKLPAIDAPELGSSPPCVLNLQIGVSLADHRNLAGSFSELGLILRYHTSVEPIQL